MLNKSSEAAIAAMSRLAEVYGGEHSSQTAAEIARARDLPHPFIAKVLTLLSRHGLVRGTQGRRGGYALARKPAEITLYDIAACFGRLERPLGCPLGPRRCQRKTPCPVHHDLVGIQDRLRVFLEGTTLAVFHEPAAAGAAPSSAVDTRSRPGRPRLRKRRLGTGNTLARSLLGKQPRR